MSLQDNGIFNNLMNYNSVEHKAEETKKQVKPSEKLLSDLKGFGFEMSQLESILKCQGNQLILSCAGSGKTTALIFKVIFDQRTGWATRVKEVNGNKIRVIDKTWVCTFLKSGADELKSSLVQWQHRLHCGDTSSAVQFSTLHAEFMRALNLMGVTTNIINASTNTSYLREIVKGYSLQNAEGNPMNSENIRDLEGALTYTRNRLDSSRYKNDVYEELNIGPTLIDAILRDWKSMRIKNKFCDFEDLQEMLYEECYKKNNESVINYLSKRFNFIYIDEFQDTSQIQYALLKIYGRCAKQVVAIGDDDQTIYSWRGSYNGIITKEFLEDFHPIKNDLSINFRCPSNILDCIKPSIEKNKNRFSKDLQSFKKGGKCRIGGYSSYKSMISALGKLVEEDVKEGKSVAILCRVNSDGLIPSLILDKLGGIQYSISSEGMTLDSYVGRVALGIVKLFTERSTPIVKSTLSMLTWNNYCINNLMKVCKNNRMSIWDIDKNDLVYSCPEISSRLLTWRNWRETSGDIQALKLVLQDYRVNVFSKDTQFNDVVKSVISSIETLLDYYDYKYVDDFLNELETINERLKARIKKSNARVRIATVHEFKGKEADSVYVWNDSQNVFPYKGTDESLEDLEEERRVHYIACTRAKEISTIMYIKNKKGMFIDEMNLSGAEVLLEQGSDGFISNIKNKMEYEGNLNKFEEICSYEEEIELERNKRYENAENDFRMKYGKI